MKIGKGNMFYFSVIVLNFVIVFSITLWLYSLSGTKGLLQWEPFYRNIFTVIFLTAFIAPVFAVLKKFIFDRVFRKRKKIFTVITMILAVFFTLPSVAVAIYTQSGLIPENQELPPVLLFDASKEGNAYENMAIVEWSKEKRNGEIKINNGESNSDINNGIMSYKQVYHLNELKYDKKYEVKFENGENSHFYTPDIKDQRRFAFTSDAHFGRDVSDPQSTIDIVKEIYKEENKYSGFFYLGDMVETGFTGKDWIEFIKVFDMKDFAVPTYFLAGNHDVLFGGEKDYERFFSVNPENSAYTNRRGRLDFGNIHFITLPLYWGTAEFTADDKTWLENQLNDIPKSDFTVVLSHCTFYTSGIILHGMSWADHYETTTEISPILEAKGVDLVVSGHNHQMEYLEKDGVHYAVIGTAGGLLDPERTILSPYSEWYTNEYHGFLELKVNEEDFELVFRNTNGSILFDKKIKTNI